MHQKDISFFIPCRAGSQRVENKNTKTFSGVQGGLFKIKLKQLLSMDNDIPIIISTDDEKVIDIADSYNDNRIKVHVRPNHLCQPTTKVIDLIMYVPTIVSTDHVFWLHVTTPLVLPVVYKKALKKYFECLNQGYDSLMSVTKNQSFLWDQKKKEIINFNRKEIKYPQTQDLDPLYEINHAFYAMPIEKYLLYEDRIGKNPYLVELSKLESIDIDWNEDFKIAEHLFNLHVKDI